MTDIKSCLEIMRMIPFGFHQMRTSVICIMETRLKTDQNLPSFFSQSTVYFHLLERLGEISCKENVRFLIAHRRVVVENCLSCK